MNNNYQYSLDDITFKKYIDEQPERVAYIDECGHFGFDFTKNGTSRYFILTAVIVKNENINKLHDDFNQIKQKLGRGAYELKSSSLIDKNRERLMTLVLGLDISIVLLIADKERFIENSPLTQSAKSFMKYLSQRLYSILYDAYPKLKIIYDEYGYPEFRDEFKRYIEKKRTEINLFGDYDFDFINSKDETLIQLADVIGGSINKGLISEKELNYQKVLKSKISQVEYFPRLNEPYWGRINPNDVSYDSNIYCLAVNSAREYMQKNEHCEKDDDLRFRIVFLKYLLSSVECDPTRYIYADEIISHIALVTNISINKNYLFRRVVAPLRVSGVILASCKQGYKIPISVSDIETYLNSTTATIGPMLNRMGICRAKIKCSTDNERDIFDNEPFHKYKRYFDS